MTQNERIEPNCRFPAKATNAKNSHNQYRLFALFVGDMIEFLAKDLPLLLHIICYWFGDSYLLRTFNWKSHFVR